MGYNVGPRSLICRSWSTVFLATFHSLRYLGGISIVSIVTEAAKANKDAKHQESVSKNGYAAWPFPVLFCIFLVSIALAAMFAGLTIGLFGMDFVMLDIVASAGKEPERSYAKQIIPIRRYGHQLLSTLLIGNMLTMVIISQMVAAMVQSTELVNFLVATVVVLVFAEIIPMGLCSNGTYALKIGAKSAPVVSVALFILYPVAKPLGILLECLVKHDVGMIYDRNELKKLIQVHCEKYAHKSGLDVDEMRMIIGALDMQETKLVNILTPIEKVMMLDGSLPVTRELLEQLWSSGKSRVPVYIDGCRSRIIGVLYVKDLIGLAPRERENFQRVQDVLLGNPRNMVVVPETMRLQDILRVFLSSTSHMLFVERADAESESSTQNVDSATNRKTSRSVIFSPTSVEEQHPSLVGDIIGIVTLEDVIKLIINSDIFDEYDSNVDDDEVYNLSGTDNETPRFQPPPRPMPRINFYSYAPDYTREVLSNDQKWVLAQFLMNTQVAFVAWRLSHIKYLIDTVGERTVWLREDEKEGPYLYTRGEPSDAFTLLLGGGIRISVGSDGFTTEKRSFSSFGEHALLNEEGFVPDYTAVVTRSSRYLRLTRKDLIAAESYINSVTRRPNRMGLQSASSTTMDKFAMEERRCMDGEEIPIP